MTFSAEPASLQHIASWRDSYRLEMNCQIIHDSIHFREGWTREFSLRAAGALVGYGSMAVAGPWKQKHAIYEFYVDPNRRDRVSELFEALLLASGAVMIETQTNGVLCPVMLHTFAGPVTSESILFHDKLTTHLPPPPGVTLRRARPDDQQDADADWVLEADGKVAGHGGMLFHYNRPYADLFMGIGEPFRRRGYGAYLVQELKRICCEAGNVPAARCNPKNLASRRTLQRAGFVPCGQLVSGMIDAKLTENP